ncbi:MAG: protease modulator HflK [Verrucomicrobia bacterium]|nr:protease modulator HflK [Verrucomicrobiota bacterium]
MSDERNHLHDDPAHKPERGQPSASTEPPVTAEDAGSQALADALRSSFFFVKAIMVVLVVIFFGSGVFSVPPQEKAIILRFGKPVGTTEEQLLGPGLHWAFPKPIDEVVKIPIGQIQTVTSTVGWYATTPEAELAGTEAPAGPSLNPAIDGYTLTADGNIIHVRATLGYRIKDPLAYAFDFFSLSNVVQNVLNNALLYVSARTTVDSALLNNAGFKEKILARVTEQIAALKLGITLQPGEVKVIPPRYVKPAFDEVLAANVNYNTVVNKAQGEAGAVLSKARGEANAILNTGQSDRTRLLQSVAADAKAFTEQLPQYEKNPELFRQRILTETWQKILVASKDKFFLPERADGKPRELRLLLNREPAKEKTETPAKP